MPYLSHCYFLVLICAIFLNVLVRLSHKNSRLAPFTMKPKFMRISNKPQNHFMDVSFLPTEMFRNYQDKHFVSKNQVKRESLGTSHMQIEISVIKMSIQIIW